MKNTCDCIIPFYNEGQRVVNVVNSIIKVKNISKIIVVDDGSSDKTYLELTSKFPKIEVVRLEKNVGKPNAIKEGLKHSESSYILIVDGDLTIFNPNELEEAIEKITSDPEIDLIILRRVGDTTSLAFLRQDIVTSGQRILRKKDLEEVFKIKSSEHQLEFTMNDYMIRNNKKVYWMPFTIQNVWRHEKWGRKKGYKTYLKAILVNFKFGWEKIIAQTLFFCKQKAV